MRFIQRLLIIVFIFCLLLTSFQSSALEDTSTKRVKIGIRHGTSSTPLTSISSKNGLEIGFFNGNEFYAFEGYNPSDELLVRKDAFFLNLNGSYIEYQLNEQTDISNSNIQGPYHIDLGKSFASYEEAKAYMHSLPTLGYDPYIVSENGWRVWLGLFISEGEAFEAINAVKSLIDSKEVTLAPQNSQRIQVTNKNGKVLLMYDSHQNDYSFKSIASKDLLPLIKVDGKNFRGNISFKRYTDSDITVINELNIDEYLYGVLPKEMSGSWPLEALKAQAVSARNFALVKQGLHSKNGFDLCSTTHCQVYGGYDIEHPNSNNAVDETKGKTLTYNGKIISTFYHSNSGGRTENSENIWSFPMDYIKAVDDPYSLGQPNANWSIAYSKQDLEKLLLSKNIDLGSIKSLVVTDYSQNGRALKLEIIGTKEKIILEKDKIRNILGYNNIKSTWFQIESDGAVLLLNGSDVTPKKTSLESKYVATSNGIIKINTTDLNISNGKSMRPLTIESSKYVFTGKGWGHGLGMSQWGAKVMAEQGFTYDKILTHYYTGTKVE